MTTTGIKLDQETRERLKLLAEKKQRTTHWLMKEAIGRYLVEEEQFEREKAEDEARYQRYLDTGSHVSHEDLTNWLEDLSQRAQQQADAE